MASHEASRVVEHALFGFSSWGPTGDQPFKPNLVSSAISGCSACHRCPRPLNKARLTTFASPLKKSSIRTGLHINSRRLGLVDCHLPSLQYPAVLAISRVRPSQMSGSKEITVRKGAPDVALVMPPNSSNTATSIRVTSTGSNSDVEATGDDYSDFSDAEPIDLGRLPWVCVAGSGMFLICTYGEYTPI